MVTVAILGVLAAMAAPSFGLMIERWRVRDAAEALQSTIFYARSEAIKHSGNVTILKTSSANGCSAADPTQWDCGWTVFVDENNDGIQDASDVTLKVIPPPMRVAITAAGSNGYITLDRWGQLNSASSNSFDFRLTPQGKSTDDIAAAAICVGLGGGIKRLTKGDATCPS
ncbi:hypothetical protein AwPolaro_07960 [Polaromonas sp.]|nr:hypothetical protein AwPolaro_07960 [Polaromonas sp.]